MFIVVGVLLDLYSIVVVVVVFCITATLWTGVEQLVSICSS